MNLVFPGFIPWHRNYLKYLRANLLKSCNVSQEKLFLELVFEAHFISRHVMADLVTPDEAPVFIGDFILYLLCHRLVELRFDAKSIRKSVESEVVRGVIERYACSNHARPIVFESLCQLLASSALFYSDYICLRVASWKVPVITFEIAANK